MINLSKTALLALMLITAAAKSKQCLSAQRLRTALSERVIKIDHGFVGAKISVMGHKDVKDPDLIVVMMGEKTKATVAKKEKGRFGIWMIGNVVDFENVPSFYQLLSNKAIESVLSQDVLSRLEIGIRNLNFNCKSDQDLNQIYRSGMNIIAAKSKMELFLEKQSKGINMLDGASFFSANIAIPSNIKEGAYSVMTFLIKNRQITQMNMDPFYVEKTGLSHKIATLSQHYKLAYFGLCLSLAIAMGTIFFLLATVITAGASKEADAKNANSPATENKNNPA